MRHRFRWDKKYLYWGITAFCVIACAILFFMALNYLDTVKQGITKLFQILGPFIWGLVILAVVFAEIFMLALITGLFFLIIPQMYSSIETIVVNSPTYIDSLTTWATKMLTDYPEISDYVAKILGDVNTDIVSWLQTTILPKLGSVLTNVGMGVRYVVTGVYNLVIGIIVSIYILSNIEGFTASAKRMLYSIMSVDTARKFLNGLRFTDKTFNGFLMGKLLDSAIIGLICYIVCAILNMPYALLVSVMIGVTNIIPFFGPLIGAIPSAIIILMVDPFKCLIFIIFIILLQQLDGNIIGPKILGSSVGINGFWVMFSIIFGAGLFGFWGMLLGVPVFVVIYTIVNESIARKLRRSDLPIEAEAYSAFCNAPFSMYFKKFFLLNQQKFLTVFVKYANIQKCVGEEKTRTKRVKNPHIPDESPRWAHRSPRQRKKGENNAYF